MKISRIILFSSSSVSEWAITKSSPYKILFAFCVLFFVIITVISTLRIEYQADQLKNELESYRLLQDKYDREYSFMLAVYEDSMEKNAQREYLKDAISLVNPYLDEDCLIWWSGIINAGYDLICDNMNEWTLEKINSSPSSNRIAPGASLILAVAAVENRFDLVGISTRGAVGAFQLHPSLTSDMNVPDPAHPESNIRIGITYLNSLLVRFAEYEDQLELVLASYNAGPTRVQEEWIQEWGPSWQSISTGLLQTDKTFRETRNYVALVSYLMKLYISGEWRERKPLFWRNYRTEILEEARSEPLAAAESVLLQ